MIDDNIAELLHIYDQPVYVDNYKDADDRLRLGGFEQKVLVAVKEEDFTSLNEALLVKMLLACHLEMKDYYIITSASDEVIPSINQYQPETVLLFDLPLHSDIFKAMKEKYKPFRFAGKKFLLCDSLGMISATPSLKSTLWTAGLKPLFNIN